MATLSDSSATSVLSEARDGMAPRDHRERRKFTSLPDPPAGSRVGFDTHEPGLASAPHATSERRRFTPSLDLPAAFRNMSSVQGPAATHAHSRAPPRSEGDGDPGRPGSGAGLPPAKRQRGPTRPTLTELVDDLGERCVSDLKATRIRELKSVIEKSELDSMDHAATLSRTLFIASTYNAKLLRSSRDLVRQMRDDKREVAMERNFLREEVGRLRLEVQAARHVGFRKGQEASCVEVERLRKELGERTSELRALMLTSGEQAVEVADARHKISDLEGQVASLRAEAKLNAEKLESLRAQLGDGEKMIASLRDSLADATAEVTRLEGLAEETLEATNAAWEEASEKIFWKGVALCHHGFLEENASFPLTYAFLDVEGAPAEFRAARPAVAVPDATVITLDPLHVTPEDPAEPSAAVAQGDRQDGPSEGEAQVD